MNQDVRIVDPHVHIWDPRTTPRAASPLVKLIGRWPKVLDRAVKLLMPKPLVEFVGDSRYVLNAHMPDTFHRDTGAYNVDGYVHIEAGWEEKGTLGPVGETKWVDALDDPPLSLVAHADLSDTASLDAVLEAHAAASKRFVGVRDMAAAHPAKKIHNWAESEAVLTSPEFEAGYRRLGERDLSFDAWVYSNQLRDLSRLVERVPDTRVVLDHMGTPVALGGPFGGLGETSRQRDAIRRDWYDDLARLAEHPQVHLKLSGLLMCTLGFGYHEAGGPKSVQQVVDDIGSHIRNGIETFGVDCCMFASNFPMDKVSISYEMLYDAYFEIVSDYSIEDRRKLFAENAEAFYRTN